MKRLIWKDVISTNIYLLKMMGFWPSTNHIFNLYSVYSIISSMFFMAGHVLVQVIEVVFISSDLELLTEEILLCIAELLAILKIFTFIHNIKMLKRLLVTLDSDIFQPRNVHQISLVRPAIHLWKVIYHIFLVAVSICVILWVIFPVLNGSIKRYGLPFSAWYPYNTKETVFYWLTYFHQTLGALFITVGDYNVDMLMWALMVYIGAQCDILCDNLRNLGTRSGKFRPFFKRCITHHKEILDFAENCNEFFNYIMLAQFFTSSVGMALGLFQLALMRPSNFQFYTLLTTTMAIFVQIFTYCWFGNEVKSKSDEIAYAAFESAWTDQCSSVRRSLVIFIQRAQIPIQLSTFNLFYLSLDTFVKILRSAASYYTVLRQIGGPQ